MTEGNKMNLAFLMISALVLKVCVTRDWFRPQHASILGPADERLRARPVRETRTP